MQTPHMDPRDLSRFHVQSSDVISDMRVNVSEEGSDKVLWYKERFLADEEIIEHLVENASSTILWTIHRPKRGWYIRLSTPSFPPGMFIPLLPLPQTSPYHADSALNFACRTNPPSYSLSTTPRTAFSDSARDSMDSDITVTEGPREAVHSYPPTPPPQTPIVVVRPPSPTAVQAKLEEIAPSPSSSSAPMKRLKRPPPSPLSPITHFLLTPHSAPLIPQAPPSTSLFTRVMSALKNNAPSHSYSFTLSPIPPLQPPVTSPGGQRNAPTPTPIPLLTFHDRTNARCGHELLCRRGLDILRVPRGEGELPGRSQRLMSVHAPLGFVSTGFFSCGTGYPIAITKCNVTLWCASHWPGYKH